VPGEGFFHLIATCLKGRQQIAMSTLKILEHVGKLARRRPALRLIHAVDNVIGAGLSLGRKSLGSVAG